MAELKQGSFCSFGLTKTLFTLLSSSDTPRYENIDFLLPENWLLSTLGEAFYMHAGKSILASKISSNADETYRYKCIGGNGLRGYVQQFNTEGSFPIIGRQGALCGNINYVEGRFYATEHAVVVDTFCETNVKWAFYFLIQLNLNQYATATAQPGLSVNTIGDVQIPIPPKEEQCRIVSNIEQWFRIIDTLEREKDELEENIKIAKSKILDLAIHGKLVPQDPNDEPAVELLKRISPSFTPCDNAHDTNQLPESWEMAYFQDCCDTIPSKPYQILQSEIQEEGKYPVVSQSANYIEGYSNQEDCVMRVGCPALLFGDHTRILKYVDFDFIIGADGVKILIPKVDSKYLFYALTVIVQSMSNRGYARHYSLLSKSLVPIPPIEEQQRIVAKIEELFTVLDENRVGGKRSSFLPTFVFRPLTPPYVPFGIRRFLFWIPFEI